eukprot:TRINITY_DN81383_c0_g1_i1.p1 TRINITY_DN81383_c0_g1~~TRINITY_DN81383_c0_g1_i1.p1  ORF type:complete len:272 (-),score=60.12 TRINITY_DN81383_c0_g1_i1:46-861(-)
MADPVTVSRPFPHVVEVTLNRPDKLNACSPELFDGLTAAFAALSTDDDAYVVVLRGEGKHFCAGIDLAAVTSQLMPKGSDTARSTFAMRKVIERFQKPCDLLAKLPQVTIACVHGACVGAGVDLVAACDIRYCSTDAKFSIKEVDVGLAADLGSLHRMPMVTGNMSWVRELAFTGRQFGSEEALRFGFVSNVAKDVDAAREAVYGLAQTVAGKSPVALRATKEMCEYAESHSPEECLSYVRTLNGAMLQTEDLAKSAQAFLTKKTPSFSKL